MKKMWQKFFLKKEKNKQSHHLGREISALVFFALGLFWLLSLLSFDSIDNNLHIDDGYDYKNWLGPFGAFISDIFFNFFGIFAFCYPALLFIFSYKIISKKQIFFKSKVFGIIFCFFGLNPIFSSAFGFLGLALNALYVRFFGVFGLYLINITLTIIGILLLIGKDRYLNAIERLKKIKIKTIKKSQDKSSIKEYENDDQVPIITEIKNKAETINSLNIIERNKKDLQKEIKNAENLELNHDISFDLPPLKLLDYDEPFIAPLDQSRIKNEAEKLKKAFLQFGIEGVIREIRPGPVVTLYEYIPAPGIKLSKIASLSDDIAMAMQAVQVRIVTPIPGKGAVGIEVPNEKRETVYLKEIVADEKYRHQKHPLCMAIGKDVEGQSYFMNLADMPHVLIAGTTGSGKSVSVNAMICSILYRATPKEVRFLMIDPKMLELSIYNGIPHLLLPPIIDAKKAANALKWAIKEMDDRYLLMKELGVRDINAYNQALKEKEDEKHKILPYIVVVIDEYADLLAVASKEVEGYIMRLAQKARACGIHVMLATQRPSVDVITGVIKANFPVRMGFRLASSHDSKTIINKTGAEKLLGKGDCLIMPPGTSDILRIHGAFISEKELNRVVDFLKEQKTPVYDESIADFNEELESNLFFDLSKADNRDEKFEDAINVLKEYQKCSTSFMQRQLSIGYNRAARIVEQMEKEGLVGPVLNSKGEREIFIK